MKLAHIPAIRALILDMEGVLWRGDQPIGSLPYIFSTLENHGYKVILATNNATLSAEQYLEKLRRFDVVLERWQIVNSSQATAQYLHRICPEGGAVYVIGEEGLICDLKEQGFYLSERDVLAGVVGLDLFMNWIEDEALFEKPWQEILPATDKFKALIEILLNHGTRSVSAADALKRFRT